MSYEIQEISDDRNFCNGVPALSEIQRIINQAKEKVWARRFSIPAHTYSTYHESYMPCSPFRKTPYYL